MKAILLNGSTENDLTGKRVTEKLTTQLQAAGWDVESVLLRDKKIGNCVGNFRCWISSPGTCFIDDDNRSIAAAVANSDLMVYLTSVTFGGYSSTLKRMVDHQIQNISPFFAKVNGETHHQRRYDRYPNFLTVGWMNAPDPRAEVIFRHLAQRNAVNFYAQKSYCGLVDAGQSDAEIQAQVETWLRALSNGTVPPAVSALPEMNTAIDSAPAPRRAVLLVGSPRTRKSTSHSIGSYLMKQLAARGIETEVIQIYTSLNSPEKMRLLLEKLDAADLAVLSFPLYVDSLPAPVIAALERIAAHRAGHQGKTRLVTLVNCGFPEAQHNNTALAICEEFSRQSALNWAGSLSLGAGEGMVHGVPLDEMDGRVHALKKALDLAAESLAEGKAIPKAAQDLLDKPFIPGWLYRLIGGFGWKQQAKKYGAEKDLRRQSYL